MVVSFLWLVIQDNDPGDPIVSPLSLAVHQEVLVLFLDLDPLPDLPLQTGLPSSVKFKRELWCLIRMVVLLVFHHGVGLCSSSNVPGMILGPIIPGSVTFPPIHCSAPVAGHTVCDVSGFTAPW